MRICAGFQILVSGRAYTYDTSWTHDCTIVLKCSFKRKGLRQKKCYTDDVGAWPKTMVRTLVPKMMRKQVTYEYQNCIFKNCNHISIIFCAFQLLKSFYLHVFLLFNIKFDSLFARKLRLLHWYTIYWDQNDLDFNWHYKITWFCIYVLKDISWIFFIEMSVHLVWLIQN